jgi:hypothetical protein
MGIFRLKGKEVTGASIIIHFIKYYYNNHTKEDEMGEVCRAHDGDKKSYQILSGKPEENNPRNI